MVDGDTGWSGADGDMSHIIERSNIMSIPIIRSTTQIDPQQVTQHVTDALRAVFPTVGIRRTLTRQELRRLRSQNDRISDESLNQLAHVSSSTGGVVVGIPYDGHRVKEVLASVGAGRLVAADLRGLADSLDAEMVVSRGEIARAGQAALEALAAQAKLRDEAAPLVEEVRAAKVRRRVKKAPVAAAPAVEPKP